MAGTVKLHSHIVILDVQICLDPLLNVLKDDAFKTDLWRRSNVVYELLLFTCVKWRIHIAITRTLLVSLVVIIGAIVNLSDLFEALAVLFVHLFGKFPILRVLFVHFNDFI